MLVPVPQKRANHVNYWVSCVCCQEKNMQPSKLGSNNLIPGEQGKKTTKERNMKKLVTQTLPKKQPCLRKKVTSIMKKQKSGQIRKIVKNENNSTWGQAAHAQVRSRFIELFIESAYIQPPVGQSSGGLPDIGPAFGYK